MRQHASKQISIPNNLRVIQSPISRQIATKDTNKRRSVTQTTPATATTITTSAQPTPIPAIAQNIESKAIVATAENISASSQCDSGVAVTNDINAKPGGKSAMAKTSRIKDTRDVKAKRNEWRITKMVLAIFLSFAMCYLPITVAKIADKDVSYPACHIIGYLLLYLSACINPIIYVIMNKQYRQAYKTVILCKPGRLLAFTQAGSSVGGKI